MKLFRSDFLCVALAVFFAGCSRPTGTQVQAKSNRVVLYCSVDDVYAKPIIRDLEKQTGLQIDVLYDIEAAKTAGLANRIRGEKSRPQGDVFWSSALLQTLLLSREGLIEPYISPSAKDIPEAFKAKDGTWTGLGVRARVLVHHPSKDDHRKEQLPSAMQDLKRAQLNSTGISNPQFGTASDWTAALAVRWGKQETLGFFKRLKHLNVYVLPGNSVVAEKVARGDLIWGVTDTDDYIAARQKVVKTGIRLIPTHDPIFIPGSVAILKNAPHDANARKLVDALLKTETEKQLVKTMIGVIPTRTQIKLTQPELKTLADQLENVPDDTTKWAGVWDAIREPLADTLLKD